MKICVSLRFNINTYPTAEISVNSVNVITSLAILSPGVFSLPVLKTFAIKTIFSPEMLLVSYITVIVSEVPLAM